MNTRTRFAAGVLVLLAAALGGCDTHVPLDQRVKQVYDMGSLPLPNSRYQLHGYRVINSYDHDHFVYLVELDGEPIAGTASNRTVSQGKNGSRNVMVQSLVSGIAETKPTAVVEESEPSIQAQRTPTQEQGARLQVSCATQAQCDQITAAIRALQ